MKYIFLFCLIPCLPHAALGQVVNPTIIYQDTDIALHNTDVYYRPFAPPDSTDTPLGLSCLGSMDSDGITHYYYPIFHGGQLATAHPCGDSVGDTIGNAVPWQRLFSANDKTSGAHSNLIAGGNPGDRVIISKNEDVDFRATGRIMLKSGFHAMPGCRFHAYTAPKFDTTVFSDEFNDTAKFNNQWLVYNNTYAGPAQGPDCSFDSNVVLDTDYEAEDGHALRIDLKENLDTCDCINLGRIASPCTLDSLRPVKIKKYQFSTVLLQSCPFPFNRGTDPISTAYQNAPYGKWEVREKVPIIEHHTNNYGSGQSNEWNLNEKVNGGLNQIHPGFTRRFLHGPFLGRFGMRGDTQIFQCSQAHFTSWNSPSLISINNFPYEVQFQNYPVDTFLTPSATTIHEGGFPSSLLADSANLVTFYYYKNTSNTSDSLAWSVDSTGTHFTGPYADSLGDSLFFNKGYQPTAVYLRPNAFLQPIKYNCHWDHRDGKILLTDTMSPSVSHTGYGFLYDVNEGPDYPVPPITVDTTSYKYHTYTMELLPHEAYFLVDGAVRYRFPDRLIPIGDPQYDFVTNAPRAPMSIEPGEIDMDGDPSDTSSGSIYYMEKSYFESHVDTCLGCWPVNGVPAAHHRIDYVKVWDLPTDMIVPKFPH